MTASDVWEEVSSEAAKWYSRHLEARHFEYRLVVLDREASGRFDPDFDRTATLVFPAIGPLEKIDGIETAKFAGLFFTPLMLRLNYVAQLSTSYLRSNLDAKHCRLSHALGTFTTLIRLINMGLRRIAEQPRLESCRPNRLDIVSALTYAALHDAFQGPFGHSLDPLRDHLLPHGFHGNRRLDKALFAYITACAYNYCLDSEHEKKQAPCGVKTLVDEVSHLIADPFKLKTEDIFNWLIRVGDPPTDSPPQVEHWHQVNWLRELIEGPLDGDRWDYLWRDTLHLGFSADHRNIEEAFWKFQEGFDIYFDGTSSHLVVPEALAQDVGRVFFAVRANLYKSIYEHPAKRVIDACLNRCVFLGLFQEFSIPPAGTWMKGEYPRRIVDFSHLTDSDLLTVLDRLPDSDFAPLIRLYIREIQTYPMFGLAFSALIRPSAAEAILSRLPLATQSLAQTQPPSYSSTPTDELKTMCRQAAAVLRHQREHVGDSSGLALEVALHCHLIAYNPLAVLQFDRLIWKRLGARQDTAAIVGGKLLATIADLLERQRLAMNIDLIRKIINSFPPIFSAFPWLPSPASGSLNTVSRSPLGESIHVRQPNGLVVTRDAGAFLKPRAGDESGEADISFTIGYPLAFADGLTDDELELLRIAIAEETMSLLRSGFCLALQDSYRFEDSDNTILSLLSPLSIGRFGLRS